MSNFIHPQAICESEHVGEGTRIWPFVHVLAGARIGQDCNLAEHVFIENDVVVGDRVTLKCGVQLWDGLRLEDDVFVGPNATFTNDLFPRSRHYQDSPLQTVVRRGASIGANATILPGLTIGRDALVGAGAVITRDVPDYAVAAGNPARVTGYVDTSRIGPVEGGQPRAARGDEESAVRGVRLVTLTSAMDMRGALVAGEVGSAVPFEPRRFFVVHDVPSAEIRGAHAHRTCAQFLVCLNGSVSAIVDDGVSRAEYVLNRPDVGLFMPPMIWGTQYHYSANAVLLVLASHHYDSDDYIRSYDEFADILGQRG